MTRKFSAEPFVTVNGTPLNTAQSGALRVALTQFEPDCGDDDLGRQMTADYRRLKHEVLELMLRISQLRAPI